MPWIERLVRHFRPREGWTLFLLAAAITFCFPAAAIDAQWLVGLESGVLLAALGFLLGWRLGHVRRHPALAWPLIVASGTLADLIWGVYVVNLGWLWLAAGELLRYLGWWLDPRLVGLLQPVFGPAPAEAVRQAQAPALQSAAAQGDALRGFSERVVWWVGGLLGRRQAVPDNLVVAGLALLVIWLAASWAAWYIARRGRPFEALLPAFVLMAVQAFIVNRGHAWLLLALALLPLLMALARSHVLARRWEAEGADYSTELGINAAFAGGAVALLVLVLTPTLPFLTSKDVADAFWRLFEKPYRQVEQRVNESFPAAPGARSLVPATGVAEGGLPRSHLLGGRPELGRRVALRVTVRGQQGSDVLYWRGQTFSVYDGHGWESDPGTARVEALQAGQPWFDEQLAARHSVLSFVDVYGASLAVLYAPGEPVSVDRPYRAMTRLPGDLISLTAPGGPDTYTILSSVPDENPNALRAAGTDYPQVIADLYLRLPENLPPELSDYAARLTTGTETPYDAAFAIEQVLRQIPYSLEIPTPPANRELSSWFLFDLKRGYCDYYATAMVVLARLHGIPARLAVGYATGDFDANAGYYQVTELQAHSWPEIYFPRIGWVPFEPTASEPEPLRVPGEIPASLRNPGPPERLSDPGLVELEQRGAENAAEAARRARLGLALAGLNGLLAAWTAWRLVRPGMIETADAPARDFRRMAGWGQRLGRPVLSGETAREYAAALVTAARDAAGRARLDPAGAAHAAAAAQQEAARLAEQFELLEYGPKLQPSPAKRGRRDMPETAGEDRRWQPLWSALRRLWLARRWRV